MSPVAFGYLSLPPVAPWSDDESALRAASEHLAAFARREGYGLCGVFTDIRGRTESGLYEMLTRLRRGDAVAVIVPNLEHLRHTGCLADADLATASRYLRVRLLELMPSADPHRLLALTRSY